MFLPVWAELRCGAELSGDVGLLASDRRRSPPLQDASHYNVTSESYRFVKGETWVNPYACLLAIYILEYESLNPSLCGIRIAWRNVFSFFLLDFLAYNYLPQKEVFLAIVCLFSLEE